MNDNNPLTAQTELDRYMVQNSKKAVNGNLGKKKVKPTAIECV
jgi:hypothetical protein